MPLTTKHKNFESILRFSTWDLSATSLCSGPKNRIDYNVIIHYRFLHEDSEVPFFTKDAGKAAETTAILVNAEKSSFTPLVQLLKVAR